MITEDYVSFETAKLLKEKGFDEPCECLYDTENNDVSIVNGWMTVSNSELEGGQFVRYSAPSLQMAMKWLREVHNIIIELHHQYKTEWYTIVSSEHPLGIGVHTTNTYNTYEQAAEAAIKYCLENLI